jgi:tetratricopeptide (TPR) repeat protein
VVVVTGWSAGAALGAKPWRDELSLWTRIAALADHNTRTSKSSTFERSEYHANVAMAYYEQRRYGEMMAAARKAIDVEPRCAEARLVAGMAYGATGQRQQSIREYLLAIQYAPKDVQMYVNFGGQLIWFGMNREAVNYLKKAIELAPHNIQVNAIAPGWIETDMTAPVHTMPLNDEILARTPAGRWGQAEEVAGTAVYLASRASDFVTGTTIRVDGGYAIR